LVNDEELGEEWFPQRSKIVVTQTFDKVAGPILRFVVDPGFPNRWREEPYHSTIKQAARAGLPSRWQTRVEQGDKTWVVLPNKEIELKHGWEVGLVVHKGNYWDFLQFKNQEEAAEFGVLLTNAERWADSLSDDERLMAHVAIQATIMQMAKSAPNRMK
jgi:hypothetical protein